MSAIESLSNERKYGLIIPCISALLIVLFFFYIDEGYYDFRWMEDPANVVVFGMYMAFFFAIQFLIFNFALSFLKRAIKNIVMLAVVTPALVVLILWLLR